MIVNLAREECRDECIEHGRETCTGCSNSIGRSGAKFSLEGTPGPHLVIDMDKVINAEDKPACDYLLLADSVNDSCDWVAPVEITSSRGKKVGTIRRQLQSGAEYVEQKFGFARSAKFVAVLVGKASDIRKLRKQQIKYFGKKHGIKTMLNGGRIADVLK